MSELLQFIDSRTSEGMDMQEIVSTLCADGQLRECLLIASKDLASLSRVLCYRHPNGFYKLKLLSPGTHAWALRLHVWDTPAPASDVHNHRWDFASYVISGRLRESRFTLVHGTGSAQVFTLSRSADGGYRRAPEGVCELNETSHYVHTRGQSYALGHRVLHRAEPDGDFPVITAVLQGADLADATTVVPGSAKEDDLAVRQLDPEATARLMEMAAERLDV